ncbi:MAG: Asparagine synthetase [glutamine-hydrolyzing] 1 [Chlamydiae bacterium]|nr:Asparagine synthetase [glutamine-hydrolyzing] 1 [Chlamydiota bacterium]
MCGIVGLIDPFCKKEVLSRQLEKGCQLLKHRGPDDQGMYLEEGAGFGVRRLAIQDLVNGKQPFYYRNHVLFFNGELYGIHSLRHNLIQLGYPISTNCDTEVFLYAYFHYKENFLDQLSGMFAFAIWNSETKQLVIGRDRWGEKPLYYTQNGNYFAFASEIHAFKAFEKTDWTISKPDIYFFLQHSHLLVPKTGWENIHKLEQGSILTFKEGKVDFYRYFNFLQTIQKKTIQKTPTQFLDILNTSVKECLVSDRPVGAFLSGGVDSSSIVALAKKHLDIPVFSLCWDNPKYTEETYSNMLVRHLNLKHYKTSCTPNYFKQHFDSIAASYGELFGDESMIPTSCLAEFAKSHVDVVLTGDGGDELFHGYDRYFFNDLDFMKYLDIFSALPKQLKEKSHLSRIQVDNHPYIELHEFIIKSTHPLRARSYLDLITYLTNTILTKVDRATMRVSLESRAPFLQKRITDFILGTKIEDLHSSRLRKKILKDAVCHLLPSKILNREKKGFGMPLEFWFSQDLKSWLIERLHSSFLLSLDFIHENSVEYLIKNAGKKSHKRLIFNLLVLETWLRNQPKYIC